MRASKHAAAALVAATAFVASAPSAGGAQPTIREPGLFDLRDRDGLRFGDGTGSITRDADVVRASVSGFASIPEGDLALLGCDVFVVGGPEVVFLQVANDTGLLGIPELVGESCAETLDELLADGLDIDETRTVRRSGAGGTFDILVWVLIRAQ